jgi:hypothetical protein
MDGRLPEQAKPVYGQLTTPRVVELAPPAPISQFAPLWETAVKAIATPLELADSEAQRILDRPVNDITADIAGIGNVLFRSGIKHIRDIFVLGRCGLGHIMGPNKINRIQTALTKHIPTLPLPLPQISEIDFVAQICPTPSSITWLYLLERFPCAPGDLFFHKKYRERRSVVSIMDIVETDPEELVAWGMSPRMSRNTFEMLRTTALSVEEEYLAARQSMHNQ